MTRIEIALLLPAVPDARDACVQRLGDLLSAKEGIGIPNNSVLKYETELKNGKLLLVVHGTPDEVEQAKGVLQSANLTTTVHGEPVVAAT